MVRGIRSLIEKSAPGKLSRSGKFACFRARTENNRPTGPKLRGITKLLSKRIFSSATLPTVGTWRGGAWKGSNGGLRRGKAVDSQVSRLSKVSVAARKKSKMLKLTKLTFNALSYHGLVPIGSQRVVIDTRLRVGTAVDVVCTRGEHELVLVELKTGFGGDRSVGVGTKMQAPLHKAKDCNLHRHFSQLAVTLHLFEKETSTIAKLLSKKVDTVSACLLYVNGDVSEKFDLPQWWRKRGIQIVERISSNGHS